MPYKHLTKRTVPTARRPAHWLHQHCGTYMCWWRVPAVSSYVGTQTLINIAEADSHRQRYDFSDTKTKILKIEPNKTGQIEKPLFLSGSETDYSQEETHLGIKTTDDGKPKATIMSKITTSRRAAYAHMGAGLHGLNGTCQSRNINSYGKHLYKANFDERVRCFVFGGKGLWIAGIAPSKIVKKHTASSHLNSKTSTVSAFGIPTTGGNTSSTSFITIWQDCTKIQLYRTWTRTTTTSHERYKLEQLVLSQLELSLLNTICPQQSNYYKIPHQKNAGRKHIKKR